MNRRGFFAALAGLPFVGRFMPTRTVDIEAFIEDAAKPIQFYIPPSTGQLSGVWNHVDDDALPLSYYKVTYKYLNANGEEMPLPGPLTMATKRKRKRHRATA